MSQDVDSDAPRVRHRSTEDSSLIQCNQDLSSSGGSLSGNIDWYVYAGLVPEEADML